MAKEFAERAWPDSQTLVATHVDARHIADTFGSADNLGSDLAYLAGDLATVIDENYRPQDSTTMRQPRRRKRAPGQKPDEHDYEQKMEGETPIGKYKEN